MKLDLSCPIELRGYTLSYSDNAAQACVRLYNLTNRRIASFEAIAKWRGPSTERSIARPFRAERLRAGAENGFRIDLVCDALPDANQLDLVFTAVCFEDGVDDWRAGEGTIVEISPIEPIAREQLEALRQSAGQDAVCFARQDDNLWRCLCGRVNPNDDSNCVRCHRTRGEALRYTSENLYIPRTETPAEPDKEDDALVAELYSKFLRQRRRLFRRTVAIALAALALTVALVMSYDAGHASQASAEVISIYTPVAQQEDLP